MLLCTLILYLLHHVYASSEVHYECGPHGKFEYCVDETPDCVVGCHCHPGYYFDTDTKICEANIKLTQFRRHYGFEPTRIPQGNFEHATLPTPTTTLNPIDAKVDAIAKDTDDLGDWLYNQFFKTIENQVINNTDNEIKTRRSGGKPGRPLKPKRRSRKRRKKSKRKKSKKKGLRNKLLRITEDDSLFDSSSGSNSEETDSSCSESESNSNSESSDDPSNDHDHRKIIMINKKPTPPLPSFIFLPNMETPFYPPIGLPAPPIMPMYPMVPVPPMGVLYPGQVETTTCSSGSASKSSSASHGTSTEAVTTTLDGASSSSVKHENPSESQPENPSPDGDGAAVPQPEEETPPASPDNPSKRLRSGRPGRFNNKLRDLKNKNVRRNKFLQKIRDKMKKRNQKPNPQMQSFIESFQDFESPYDPVEPSHEMQQKPFDEVPILQDVDFKYLSQLIHKIDLNQTSSSTQYSPITDTLFDARLPLRRNNQNLRPIPKSFLEYAQRSRPVSKADEVKDSYFINLGKQIASLIRKFDKKGEREFNIEIEQQNQHNPTQTMFNEHSFAPRSYWERYVRSPYQMLKSAFGKFRGQKHSNENLENLENQVRIATASERSMDLQELENIANMMEQTQNRKIVHNRKLKPAEIRPKLNNRLNINLLPQTATRTRWSSSHTDNIKMTQVSGSKKHLNVSRYIYQPKIIPSMGTTTPRADNGLNLSQVNRANTFVDVNKATKINTLQNLIRLHNPTLLQDQVSRLIHKNYTTPFFSTTEQVMKYQVNPIMLNYKSINYVSNNHNKYHVQRSFMPMPIPNLYKGNPSTVYKRPSYFHHEEHNFDYFDI